MPEINELLPKEELEALSRRERKKQETRWRIYEAAMTLFDTHGYDSVKIEDICEEADASNAAFFHHFSNKASLVRAYLEEMKADIGEKLNAVDDASSTEKLKLISREVSRAASDVATFSVQMFGAIASGDTALDLEPDTGLMNTMTEIIRDGQARGEFSKGVNPQVVAVSLVSSWLMLPLATQSSSFPKKPHDKLMDFMLAGLTK